MSAENFYFAMFTLSIIASIALLQLKDADLMVKSSWPLITALWFALFLHAKYKRSDEKNE